MNSKISFFNKGLFLSNIKRFLWAGILETLVMFLCFPFNLMIKTPRASWAENFADILERYSEYPLLANLTICVYAVVLAVLLFSYLHKPKMTTALHGLPVSRTTLFISTALSGIVLLIAPVLINLLLIILIKYTMGIGTWIVMSSVLRWAVYAICLSLVLFAFATFIGMFTGNPATHLIFTYIVHFLPLAFFAGFMVMCEMFLLGFDPAFNIPKWIMDLPMMTVALDFTEPCTHYIILNLILTAIFFVLGILVYKKRPLENAGDIVVFTWVKPVFKYGVSLCFSVAGFLYTAAISNMDTNSGMLTPTLLGMLWGAIGFCIAQMLILKTWRIFGAYKEFFGVLAVIAVIFAGFQSDITGFEKRLVAPLDVSQVSVNGFYNFPQSQITFTDANAIEIVTRLHEGAIKNNGKFNENDYNVHMGLEYVLKNGKKIKRVYQVKSEPLLMELYNHPEAKLGGYPMLYDDVERIVSISTYNGGKQLYINEKDILLDALRKDIEAMKISPWWTEYTYPPQADMATKAENTSIYLEFEMMPEGSAKTDLRTPYRNYYNIRVLEDEMPNAFALLSEILK